MASFGVSIKPRRPGHPPLVKKMPSHFLHARTCYDHLAGEMAVKVLEAILKMKWLIQTEQEFQVTRLGRGKLTELGVDLSSVPKRRRVFARSCVDLTQRRPHLAGILGAALLDLYVHEGWILRADRSRVVSITPKGHQAFKRVLDIAL
jgi:hypothetical protein